MNDRPPMHIDRLHIEMIGQAAHRPDVRSVIEVGCWMGDCTTPLVGLLQAGVIDSLACIDIRPQDALRKLLAGAGHRATLFEGSYPKFYNDTGRVADMVIIDADHRLPALADLAIAVLTNAKVIVLHDTNAYTGLNLTDCWGAEMAGRLLRASGHYDIFEDKEQREGMWTHRGLMIAQRKP